MSWRELSAKDLASILAKHANLAPNTKQIVKESRSKNAEKPRLTIRDAKQALESSGATRAQINLILDEWRTFSKSDSHQSRFKPAEVTPAQS